MTTTLHKMDIDEQETLASLPVQLQFGEAASEPVEDTPDPVDREALKRDILGHLEAIGLVGGRPKAVLDKSTIRTIHHVHRKTAGQRIRRALGKKLDAFMDEIANGDEVDPEKIRPELIEARSGTRTGDLFRFATLLWSIPVSQGYGRRLRFLVKDKQNGKLIGLFALGDPVFNLKCRDDWIEWDQAARREKLVNVMDAYVVGAMPPYAELLGGKLVTSLIASKEVADLFDQRYGDLPGTISRKRKKARLVLVTVTSALGRSSIYNRLKLRGPDQAADDEQAEDEGYSETVVVELRRLGETIGYGHFQITDDLFSQLRGVLREDGHGYVDGHQFGNGPNWRIRVLRVGLKTIGLEPDTILKHGIQREVYAMPVASNAKDYLSGRVAEPEFDHRTVKEISELALDRWVLPRSMRRPAYRRFNRDWIRDTIASGG